MSDTSTDAALKEPNPSLVEMATSAAQSHAGNPAMAGASGDSGALDQFLRESSLAGSIWLWLGERLKNSRYKVTRDLITRLICCDIAFIDRLLNDQVNAIIHHPTFQRLEASWRGVRFLVDKLEGGDEVKIRVLTISWRDLTKDITQAIEFDQSQLFGKIYSEEFGIAGGEPYGLLLADFEIRHRPSQDYKFDDIETLRGLSQIAAAAFAPMILGCHPSFLSLDSFSQLERPLNLSRTFEQAEYIKWKALRDIEDARFLGLTLPRVLMRVPYHDDNSRIDGFRFHEDTSGVDNSKYLWGTAIYAFASVVMRAFYQCGWLADIRGVRRDLDEGGLVVGLPIDEFDTDSPGIAIKFPTDVVISDDREKELGDLGLIPLCPCKDTPFAAFYGNQSIQKAKKYDDPAATVNARISTMLQYMFCVSRFAHYVKVLGREKIGSFQEPDEFENYVHRWLHQYVTGDDEASNEVKSKYPLREAKIAIREVPGKPGHYMCVVHLRPHFQLDELVASVRLVTETAPA